jgi:hypothetical protein
LRRATLAAAAVLLSGQAWACRDAPSPWEPPTEEIPIGARQLTFNPGDDRSPAWSIGGDSILYVAEGIGDLARSDGVLVSIPSKGGTAASVFPVLQPARVTAPAILAPAVEPGTGRIAYAQRLHAQGVCTGDATSCDATDTLSPPPDLQLGRLRVRAPGSTTPADQDPTLSMTFDGVEFDDSRHPFGLSGVWITRLHPFQRRYNELSLLPVRPSWDPEGGRLVTSDGLRLLIWSPGETGASPIPGTVDASWPAWSPDGTTIAFTRLERGPELRTTCQHLSFGPIGTIVSCVEERTQWPIGRAVILTIPPGGGEPLELLEGTDPAWSPDGAWLYVARPDGIWRVAAGGGVLGRVEGTEGGTQPAVSPDGTELAFTKRSEDGKGDIWVVPLP